MSILLAFHQPCFLVFLLWKIMYGIFRGYFTLEFCVSITSIVVTKSSAWCNADMALLCHPYGFSKSLWRNYITIPLTHQCSTRTFKIWPISVNKKNQIVPSIGRKKKLKSEKIDPKFWTCRICTNYIFHITIDLWRTIRRSRREKKHYNKHLKNIGTKRKNNSKGKCLSSANSYLSAALKSVSFRCVYAFFVLNDAYCSLFPYCRNRTFPFPYHFSFPYYGLGLINPPDGMDLLRLRTPVAGMHEDTETIP